MSVTVTQRHILVSQNSESLCVALHALRWANMVQKFTPSCSRSSTWAHTLIQHHDNSGQTHISKEHIRWHANHSAHVTRWRHPHRNTNRNWPVQHMRACRWAFRLRSVQNSGHILLVTYSFWLSEWSTFSFVFVFLTCLWVWCFTPLIQTHSGWNQKSLLQSWKSSPQLSENA